LTVLDARAKAAGGGTATSFASRPVSYALAALGRLDSSGRLQTPGAIRLRRALALLFLAYSVVLISDRARHGNLPTPGEVVLVLFSVAVYVGRGGRFVRDLLPIATGLISYALLGSYAQKLSFGVHYLPQIRVDRLLGLGTVLTIWLQDHLYSGAIGPISPSSACSSPGVFGFVGLSTCSGCRRSELRSPSSTRVSTT
jgi:hypothetical protein